MATLLLLDEEGELTIKQIAELVGRSISATSRLLDQLVERGMVSRREDERDRRGTRLGAGPPKQYQPVGGVPMVLRALRPFVAHPEVAQVVLVLPPADAAAPPEFLRGLAGAGLLVVPGG